MLVPAVSLRSTVGYHLCSLRGQSPPGSCPLSEPVRPSAYLRVPARLKKIRYRTTFNLSAQFEMREPWGDVSRYVLDNCGRQVYGTAYVLV
jgi:hypothetical protein